MASTLLLRLAGPMQSWGTRSRFSERDTDMEPSKSGVIGLLCAALGRPRSESVDDLAALRMGVRVDFEGSRSVDYQTAGAGLGVMRSSGTLSKNPVVSTRHYLAGADFLVGLETEDVSVLEELDAALQAPVWQLFLGRKAYVPAVPVHLPGGGLRRGTGLVSALKTEPRPGAGSELPGGGSHPSRLRLVLDVRPGMSADVRMDQPLGAAFETRQFGPRHVATEFIELNGAGKIAAPGGA